MIHQNILPIDRAIPQQVPYDFKETPAFTPLVKQQKMDGYGRYRLEIDLVQDICIHLNLQLMKKHKNNMING